MKEGTESMIIVHVWIRLFGWKCEDEKRWGERSLPLMVCEEMKRKTDSSVVLHLHLDLTKFYKLPLYMNW